MPHIITCRRAKCYRRIGNLPERFYQTEYAAAVEENPSVCRSSGEYGRQSANTMTRSYDARLSIAQNLRQAWGTTKLFCLWEELLYIHAN